MLFNRCFSLRSLIGLAYVCLIASPAAAQAHTAKISWTNSTDTNNTNVYRLTGACPTGTAGFTKVTATPVTNATYTDSAVVPGNYCYYVTASLNGVESIPSGTVQATVPVAPPTGLTITSVAMLINGSTETILAKWSDSNPVGQYFAFTDGAKFLGQGLTSSLTGTFAQQLTVPIGTVVTFLACDTMGSCASQKAM